MRVISVNTNGIRAANKKGFFDWLNKVDADVICIQETKAQEHQLSAPEYCPQGYFCQYHDAEKKGYSGTAVFSRHEPNNVVRGYGDPEFDNEGRYLEHFGPLYYSFDHRFAHFVVLYSDGVTEALNAADAEFGEDRLVVTALGNGFALPHTRTSSVRRSVGAIGAAPGGIECGEVNGVNRIVVVR